MVFFFSEVGIGPIKVWQSFDMTWMTVSNFSGDKIEIHGLPHGVQYLVRLHHENHELFLWETDLHTCRWCLCLHLTMGLEWHQFFSLVPATNKSNAMIDLTPNTLHCDSWWHSGYRNENNHTTSNPLFLKHHFGHFLRWSDTWRHPIWLIPNHTTQCCQQTPRKVLPSTPTRKCPASQANPQWNGWIPEILHGSKFWYSYRVQWWTPK